MSERKTITVFSFSPLFSSAEMEAIRKDVLGKTDRLIEKAFADDADKYALSTLDKAKTARQKANTSEMIFYGL